MFQSLIATLWNESHRDAWREFGKFTQQLADFRNAIVHRTRGTGLYFDGEGNFAFGDEIELIDPQHPGTKAAIGRSEIEAFIRDCVYVRRKLRGLQKRFPKRRPSRRKCPLPNLHRNQADVQQLQNSIGR